MNAANRVKKQTFIWSGYDRLNIKTNGVTEAINIDLAKVHIRIDREQRFACSVNGNSHRS